MKRLFIIPGLLLIAFCIKAQSDTLYLWPNAVPGEVEAKQEARISPNNKGDVTRISSVTNPALIVFEPKPLENNGAAVIVCPGGGYSILAIDKEGYEVAQWLNSLGYTAFVLQYRVPKNEAGALMDVQRAIRMVRSKVDMYKLDPAKIGAMGFSAGGSLSARAATRFTENTYQPEDAMDKLSCRPNFALLIYPAYLDRGENKSLTPELTIQEDTPPFFIFGTTDDSHGNSSLVMTTALRNHKIPVDLHLLHKGGHGYGMRPGNVAAETWPLLAEEWLENITECR